MAKLQDVIKAEHKIIQKRRKLISDPYPKEAGSSSVAQEGEGGVAPSCENLIGLALSGGGIRSATTNIGVLQGLAEHGVLRFVDYISAVSGGGYIGACLASLLSNKDKEPVFTSQWEKFPFREERIVLGEPDPDNYSREQMSHIRTGASYLAPRARHFSPDVMQAMGSVFISTFMTLLWFVLLIVLVASGYMAVVSWVAPGLEIKADGEVAATISSKLKSDGAFSFSVEAEVTEKKADISTKDTRKHDYASVQADLKKIFKYAKVSFEKFYEIQWPEGSFWYFAKPVGGVILFFLICSQLICHLDEGKRNICCFLLVFATACGVLWVEALLFVQDHTIETWLFKKYRIEQFADGAILIVPALFVATALFAIWLLYLFVARLDTKWKLDLRSQYHQLTGVLVVGFIFTLIWAMLPGFMAIGTEKYVALVMFLVGAVLRYAMTSKNNIFHKKGKGLSLPAKYKNWFMGIGVFVFLCLAVVYAGNVMSDLLFDGNWPVNLVGSEDPLEVVKKLGKVAMWVAIALAVFHVLVDGNKISPHYFYRDRLAEAFLKTGDTKDPKDPKDPGTRFSRDNSEMRLAELHGNGDDEEKCADWDWGPYLLLNATLNLTAAKNLKSFNRKSDIFTFSRLYVGSEETKYLETTEYKVDGGDIKLARAMAISGAAVTSVMGMNTSLAQSFACTIFGVRLGYWLPNVKRLLELKEREEQRQKGKKYFEGLLCTAWRPIKRWSAKQLRLYAELLGHTTVEGEEIYLSDGGHSGDNLGMIPLLRRRVKVLLVSDSECDPNHAFDSFNSSVRNAYVDENIKIKICLDGLRKDDKGLTKDKCAVGRIIYPDQGEDQENWLILFKNTLDGKEISAIGNYKEKSEDFPHETTADQFFTEEQFESYRALGRYGIKEALESKDTWLKACSASDRKSSREAYGFLRKMIVS